MAYMGFSVVGIPSIWTLGFCWTAWKQQVWQREAQRFMGSSKDMYRLRYSGKEDDPKSWGPRINQVGLIIPLHEAMYLASHQGPQARFIFTLKGPRVYGHRA